MILNILKSSNIINNQICIKKPFYLNINHFLYIRPKKKVSLPFKIQQEKIKNQSDKDNKKYGYLQFGMYGLIFALCFAGIPLYRVFCQHVGLIGNYDKKTYQFKKQKVKNFKKYIVKFQGQPQPGINWQFQPIQKQIIMGTSETAIVFYRLYNKQDKPIVGFSTYNITPEQSNIYFSKIQCFCFNQQMVNPKQQLLLPIFFYLQPQLAQDPDVGRIRQITVHYDFIRSNKQDLAKFAQQQLKRIQQNKKKLKQIRAKKNNMSIEQYEQYLHQQQIKQQLELQKQLESTNIVGNKNIDNNKGQVILSQIQNNIQNKYINGQQFVAIPIQRIIKLQENLKASAQI